MLLANQRIEMYNPRYWDKEACAVSENVLQLVELTKKQVNRLPLCESFHVLEVGSGTGRLTLPVAKRVKHVTALEPSEKMLAILKENALKQDVSNISYVNKTLEDIDLSVHYDLVVASFSLFMFDIKLALQKMSALADKAVYLFLSASPWLDEALQKAVYGNFNGCWSDFIFIYNILYNLGIPANVELYDYTLEQNYADLEDATAKLMQTYHIAPEKKSKLAEYLRANLVKENGKLYSNRKRKAAAIWWTKSP